MNKRGVGVLIKHTLSFAVLEEIRDPGENFLCLRVDFEGKILIICSIYGPNHADPQFFTDLQNSISRLGNHPIIVGGDWNCTVSCAQTDANIDILNMQSPPNLRHSQLLKKMCNELNLSDPFRVKFPFKQDFSFLSKDLLRKGRSRLDFFITSNDITDLIKNCQIKPHLQNKMFDHKAVSICFKDPPKVISRPTISREILSDPDLELHVALAVADTYLIHTAVLDEVTRTRLLLEVGTAKNELRQIGPDKKYFHEDYRSVFEENTRAAKIGNIRDVIDSLPFLRLQTGNFTENLADDLFMEALMNNIRNECISY